MFRRSPSFARARKPDGPQPDRGLRAPLLVFLATTVVLCIASYIGLVIVERQATDAVLRAESLRATSAAHAFADAYVQERLRREVDDAVIAVREMHRAASKESLPLGKLQLRIAKELEKRGIGESGGVYVIGPDLRFVVEPPSEGAVPRQVRNRDVRLRLRHLREGYREHTDTLAPGGVSPVLATYSRYFQEWDWVITAAAYKRNLVRDVPSEDLKPMSMASASQGSMEVFFTNSQGRTITQPYYSDHDLARLGEVISNLPPASVRLPGDDALTRWKGPGGSVYVLSPVAHTDWVSVVTAPSRWRPPAVIRMSHAFVVHLLWFSVIVMLAGGWGMVWITSVARHLRAGASEMVEEQVALRTLDLQSDRDQLDVQLSEKDEEMRRMIRKNGELVTRLEDLRQTSYEVNLLNQTGDLLQACQTMEETDSIVAEMVRELFPRAAGMLCRQSETQSFLEVVASWRDPLLGQTEIAVEDCWALRRGREYAIDSADAELICPHVPESPPHGYICLPMIAQGELLGLLHLQWAGPDSGVGEEQWQRHLASRKRLALRVTEQFSLALANLKLREMLRGQSIRDQLTGLYNRRHMEESLTREIHRANRHGQPMGIIMLDVDHFKQFNDTYGHEDGDVLLRELGALLRTNTRQEDIACRYGGEEFLVIMPEAPLDIVHERAEILRDKVRRQLTLKQDPITISVGVAVYPDHGLTTEAVLGAADQALYRAKNEGRDRVVVWQPDGPTA